MEGAMKKIIMILVFMLISAWYCPAEDNPLLGKFNTPFGVPDFGKIKEEHYLPAFKGALKLHDTEIEAIVNNKKPATFENTIEALDRSGEILAQVSGVFDVLNESMTNDNMQKIASEV